MGKHIFRVMFLVLALGMLISGICLLSSDTQCYKYVGKVLLDENEYEQFKEYLSNADVNIDEIIILSSTPKLIDYTITVKNSDYMPFDYNSKSNLKIGGSVALIILGCLTFVPFYFLMKDKSDW